MHLVGGSLGGTIALAAAALHPDRVRSVTTFGSTLGVAAPAEAIEAMVDELTAKGTEAYFADLAPLIVGAAYRADERVLAAVRAAVGSRDPSIIADILRGAFTRGHPSPRGEGRRARCSPRPAPRIRPVRRR